MRKVVFLMTRYSVVGKAQHTWNLARTAADHAEYKAKLLNESRLAGRLEAFKHITIASVLAQRPNELEVHWVVLIAAELAAQHRADLSMALAPVVAAGINVSLVKVSDSDEAADLEQDIFAGMGMAARVTVNRALGSTPAIFASVRLDDDDALAASYLANLADYLDDRFVGSHISFALGLQARYNSSNKVLSDARVVNKPLIALGLAFINSFDGQRFAAEQVHVLNFGNHSEIIDKTEVITVSEQPAYLRVLTDSSDLGDAKHDGHRPATSSEISALALPLRIKPPRTGLFGKKR